MPTLQLRYLSSGLTYTAELDRVRIEESTDGQANAEVELQADQWLPIKARLDERLDSFEVLVDGDAEHSGRYADSQEVGPRVHLQIGSWEEDARTAAPTGPSLAFNQNDELVARDLITRMPGLFPGTVESVHGTVDLSLPRRSPAGALRSLARATGALVRYTPHRTVEYAKELGTRRIGQESQILRMGDEHTAGTVERLEIEHDARLDPTHVLVLGAGEGADQVAATAVNPTYAGGRQVWERLEDNRIQTVSEARLVAEAHIADLAAAPASLKVRAINVDLWPRPALGDRFHVVDEDRGVDAYLRVVERIWTLSPTGDGIECLLSNRRTARS